MTEEVGRGQDMQDLGGHLERLNFILKIGRKEAMETEAQHPVHLSQGLMNY
jgi:hypothetical protein